MKHKLEKRQNEIQTRLNELNDLLKTEDRLPTDEERTEMDGLFTEAEQVRGDLARAQKLIDEAAKHSPARRNGGRQGGEAREKAEMQAKYSFRKAIHEAAEGGKLSGLEAEIKKEGENEYRDMGKTVKGAIQIPSWFMSDPKKDTEKRTLVVDPSGTGGANKTIETELSSLIGILRPNLVLQQAGARVVTGLRGDIEFLKQTGKVSGNWLGETAASQKSNPTFDKEGRTPKRLSVYSDFSKQLIYQSSVGIESLIRDELRKAIGENTEYAFLNGSGTDPVPRGLLNTSGLSAVAIGANGGAPSYENLIALKKKIKKNNYSSNSMAYLSTSDIEGRLEVTQKFDGTNGMPVVSGGRMNNFPFLTSNILPEDLTKGTSTDCHPIIFGDFSQVLILQWGAVDMIVDPYAKRKEAIIEIQIDSFWNMFVRRPEAFAVIKDARDVA